MRKLFEKMFQNRLDFWIESHNMNSISQFGFRKGFGTIDCLSILSTDLETCFIEKSNCLAVFMDVASAYDNVCIDILCDILHSKQFPRIVMKTVQMLFYTRNLHIFYNNVQMDCRLSFKGLAQGSALSPLLFNLYTINIETQIHRNVNILQYADDVVIYSINNDFQSLQTDIQTSIDSINSEFKY